MKEISPSRTELPRSESLDTLPKVPASGTANAAGLNHCNTVWVPALGLPTRLARILFPKIFPVLLTGVERGQQPTVKGRPLAKVTMPLVCQPPRIQLAHPRSMFLPFPIGSS